MHTAPTYETVYAGTGRGWFVRQRAPYSGGHTERTVAGPYTSREEAETRARAERRKHCGQCGRDMNPLDAILGAVCMTCCRANHRAVAGR